MYPLYSIDARLKFSQISVHNSNYGIKILILIYKSVCQNNPFTKIFYHEDSLLVFVAKDLRWIKDGLSAWLRRLARRGWLFWIAFPEYGLAYQ